MPEILTVTTTSSDKRDWSVQLSFGQLFYVIKMTLNETIFVIQAFLLQWSMFMTKY